MLTRDEKGFLSGLSVFVGLMNLWRPSLMSFAVFEAVRENGFLAKADGIYKKTKRIGVVWFGDRSGAATNLFEGGTGFVFFDGTQTIVS